MKIHLQIIIALIFVSLGHFVVHEFAHALAAKLLGYEVVIKLNSVRPASGGYESTFHASIISLTGPIVTLLTAAFAAIIANNQKSLLAFLVVVSAAFQRVIAQVVSIGNPNDEMRVSIEYGLGAFTLPTISSLMFIGLVVYAWRGPKPKGWMLFTVWISLSLAMSMVVFGERVLPSITW